MLTSIALAFSLAAQAAPAADDDLSTGDIAAAARVVGASFDAHELELMLDDVRENLASFERLRGIPLENGLEPALYFLPSRAQRVGTTPARASRTSTLPATGTAPARPAKLEALAFKSIPELRAYLDHRVVSCVELTEMFLARLTRLDARLACVITLTAERALAQARVLDAELAAGTSRGTLHGIPWVAKDLLAVRGAPTTWGAAPFAERVLDVDAAVVERLDDAGAILIAKVTLGALAMGDVWFGGRTNNPWKLDQGSSGSSAGPASAVAAGCATFGIGSETLGSIVSPSTACGNSSLRPTFGRVSRFGAMTLSWSMDKLGPMARSARDAALVFDVVHGADPRDPTTVDAAFELDDRDASIEGLRVGYLQELENDEAYASVLEELRILELDLVPIELPDYPVQSMVFLLSAEAASAFDEFSAGDADDLLVRQSRGAWPNIFRHSRLIPAVDYLRANRLRTRLMIEFEQALAGVEACVHPSFAAGLLTMTNLTGHPTVVAPCGFREDGTPTSVSFTGRLFEDARVLRIVERWQATTDYEDRHPDL